MVSPNIPTTDPQALMKDLKHGTIEKRLQAVNAFPFCLWSTPDSTLRTQMMDALIRTLKIRDKRLRNAIHQALIKTNKNLVDQPVREYLLNSLTILIQGEDQEVASLATNIFLVIYNQTGIIKDLKLQAWYCVLKNEIAQAISLETSAVDPLVHAFIKARRASMPGYSSDDVYEDWVRWVKETPGIKRSARYEIGQGLVSLGASVMGPLLKVYEKATGDYQNQNELCADTIVVLAWLYAKIKDGKLQQVLREAMGRKFDDADVHQVISQALDG